MANNVQLINRVRAALSHLPKVEEKRMFRGTVFMVDDKMCVSADKDELMCRIDPAIHEDLVQKEGVRTMEMKGKQCIGYVMVKEDVIRTKEAFDYWMGLSLDFNKHAKASKKRKK